MRQQCQIDDCSHKCTQMLGGVRAEHLEHESWNGIASNADWIIGMGKAFQMQRNI